MSIVAFRPIVLHGRQMLADGRARLAAQHRANSPGIQVCAALTELTDQIVNATFQAALGELPEKEAKLLQDGIVIAALGGYGRGDMAFYSDVDLLILHSKSLGAQAKKVVKVFVQDLYDIGLIVGQSLRTVDEAVNLAMGDASIFTTQIEARYLSGSEPLLQKFEQKFQRRTRRVWRRMIKQIEDARSVERDQFGETVYLLEPNVKRSSGGLRGLQLLRWIGFARYGKKDPDSLHLMGVLHQEDRDALRRAREFLLRVRNELHLHAGKSNDVLDKGEQVRIAELFGYAATDALLPVERFMQEYFRHTQAVRQITKRFVEGAQPYRRLTEWLGPWVSYSLEGEYRVGPHAITATRQGQANLQRDLTYVLRLARLANTYNKQIAYSTWKLVRDSVARHRGELTPTARQQFLEMLDNPTRLGELLRTLHELGVLEKLIPPFSHARSLLQFNEYHKFTVDEHTLRAVEAATEFAQRDDLLGTTYRNLRDKRLLHLALLIHDLGKGYVEDHSEIGQRIAADMAGPFELDERETETLKFLVHKHLSMSHLAFRRDTSDPAVILQFASDVGSPEVLSMLYVLTCADLSAVGPDVFNDWKAEVLASLYQRTLRQLTGEATAQDDDRLRIKLTELLGADAKSEWFQRQLEYLPSAYLHGASPRQLAEELRKLSKLDPQCSEAWAVYLPESQTMEYVVATHENIARGIFHKLTGALTSQGLQILSADIHTLADGLVLDRFRVKDPDFAGLPNQDRIERVKKVLVSSLDGDEPPVFRKLWQHRKKAGASNVHRQPTRVRVDNNTSSKYTILDIFATDQTGLLYTIAHRLYQSNLSVAGAKIGTYLDQVVDVFYVTDRLSGKIENEQRLRDIRQQLLDAIAQLEAEA